MAGIHDVPAEHRDEAMAALRAATGILGDAPDAERARTLVARTAFGSLATQSVECPGFPFGSLVGYATDGQGRPVLALSALAEHSRNAAADPRASLMVTDTDAASDPLALARVTLVGRIERLGRADRAEAVGTYRAVHPDAFYVTFRDFAMYRLEVTALRYVGGFGRMSWIRGAAYAAARPDPLAPYAAELVAILNSHHADDLTVGARTLGLLPGTESATLVRIDRYGMDLLAHRTGRPDRALRVRFPAPVQTPEQARVAVLEMALTRRR